MHKLIVTAVGILLGSVCLSTVVSAATNRTGAISKFSGVDEIVYECTTSASFVDLPGMSKTFKVGGKGSVPVVVMFQGGFALFGESFETGYVQLQIDDVVQGPGDQVPVISYDSAATHGFNWQSSKLAPGNHTARVQWRTDLGSSFCVDARSLIILHK